MNDRDRGWRMLSQKTRGYLSLLHNVHLSEPSVVVRMRWVAENLEIID